MGANISGKYELEDGKVACFSRDGFKTALGYKGKAMEKEGRKMSLSALMEEIAETIGVSSSALKHWSAGHNAPSDLEKVYDLANALNTNWEKLLVFEGENNMEATAAVKLEKLEYHSVKDTLRNIYSDIVSILEMERMMGWQPDDVKNAQARRMMFVALYTKLKGARMDIPEAVFHRLESFIVNYLQQFATLAAFRYWACHEAGFLQEIGEPTNDEEWAEASNTASETYACLFGGDDYDDCVSSSWRKAVYVPMDCNAEDCQLFLQHAKLDTLYMLSTCWVYDECITSINIINGAYSRLEEILKEYMVEA